MEDDELIDRVVRRFVQDITLAEDALRPLKTVCQRGTVYPAGSNIPFHSPADHLGILSGWACRQRLLPDGRRQILSFYLPGDVLLAPVAGHWIDQTAIAALTQTGAIHFPGACRGGQEPMHDGVRQLLQKSGAVEASRLLEQVIRLGYKNASDRLMHLLFDFDRRLAAVGLSDHHGFCMPLKQSVLADALGLSVVHINRVLQKLRRDGSLEIDKTMVRLNMIPRYWSG